MERLVSKMAYYVSSGTFLLLLRMRLRPIVGQPGSSSISSRVKLGQTTICLVGIQLHAIGRHPVADFRDTVFEFADGRWYSGGYI